MLLIRIWVGFSLSLYSAFFRAGLDFGGGILLILEMLLKTKTGKYKSRCQWMKMFVLIFHVRREF